MRTCRIALMSLICNAVLAVSVLAVPARAQDYQVPEHLLGGTHCHCRAKDALFPQGEEVCIMGHLRICGMSQNVSSWIQTGRTCPTSSRPQPRYALLACMRG